MIHQVNEFYSNPLSSLFNPKDEISGLKVVVRGVVAKQRVPAVVAMFVRGRLDPRVQFRG
jgi:hypothetical protein